MTNSGFQDHHHKKAKTCARRRTPVLIISEEVLNVCVLSEKIFICVTQVMYVL